MPPASDPYRTLGLDPAATPAEIKRAYRRLAKAYHPDSAGERALPRFLAIQAAYERLTSSQPVGRSPAREGSPRRSAAPSPPAPPASRPWSADAERARAARDAFRKRSTRTGPRSGPDPAGPAGSAGSGGGPGPTGPGEPAGSTGGARPAGGSRRGRPKATIGSTSYDGTEGLPFEPGWSGAGWYGAASGTYWTINPKEYADPRKHGPEYLARARRSPKSAPGSAETVGEAASEADAGTDARESRPAAGAPASAPPETGRRPPASTRASAGSSGTAGSPMDAAGDEPSIRRSTPMTAASPRPEPIARPMSRPTSGTEPISRPSDPHAAPARIHPARFAALEPARIVGSWRGRLLLAALAWFPIGLAIFGIHGQVTGCSQFLASCSDPVAWSVWIPQLIAFALLVFSPRLAWIAASGSIVLLCLTVPLAAVLTAGSGGRPPSVATTELLYAAMAAGWLAGVGIAASGRIPLPPWRVARVR